jgi:hypothetical protein
VQLTETQVSELLRGEWRITIGSLDYPDGALRGQITVVPEPGVYAFLASGFLLLFLLRKRTPRAFQSH